MATYKVPQDVEADDKLIGPFSFRQFIFLLIAIGAGALAYFLATILLPLILIPLPIAIIFAALALPLKKDQPMEVYLAAVLSYHLKPKKRFWKQDGIDSLLKITYENVVSENIPLRDLTREQADERLSFLAGVVDTEGWSIKGVQKNNIDESIINEAKQVVDINDESAEVNKAFNDMINQSQEDYKNNLIQKMTKAKESFNIPQLNQTPDLNQIYTNPQPMQFYPQNQTQRPAPYQPNPTSQTVYQPYQYSQLSSQNSQQTEIIDPKRVDPELVKLANNEDLNIQTISQQANKIKEKSNILGTDGEITISLR